MPLSDSRGEGGASGSAVSSVMSFHLSISSRVTGLEGMLSSFIWGLEYVTSLKFSSYGSEFDYKTRGLCEGLKARKQAKVPRFIDTC